MNTCSYCGNAPVSEGLISCAASDVTIDNFRDRKHPYPSGVTVPVKVQSGIFRSEKWDLGNMNPIQKWFALSQDQKLSNSIRPIFSDPQPVGLFNVEGGEAVVSSKRKSDCCDGPSFIVEDTCSVCGTSASNTVVMPAGTGDGVYPVWQEGLEPAESLVISFFSTPNNGEEIDTLWENFRDAVPLFMGTIESSGAVYVRDSSSARGQASTIIQGGEYDAVLWIAARPGSMDFESMFALIQAGADSSELAEQTLAATDIMLPIAFTLTKSGTTEIVSSAQDILVASGLKFSQIAAAIWGSTMRNVTSHMQSAEPYISIMSAQFFNQDSNEQGEKGLGTALFHVINEGSEGMNPEILKYLESEDSNQLFFGACLLMTAGHPDESLIQMEKAADAGHPIARLFFDRMTDCLKRHQDIYPIWGTTNSDYQSWLAVNIRNEQIEDALDFWALGADRGNSNSASFYTWEMLRRGDFKNAVDFYLAIDPICREKFMEQLVGLEKNLVPDEMIAQATNNVHQYVNASSNAAIAMYAMGMPVEEYLEKWTVFGKAFEHAESIFMPALIEKRNGSIDESNKLVAEFSEETKNELIDTFNSIVDSVEYCAWMKKLASEGLEMLK